VARQAEIIQRKINAGQAMHEILKVSAAPGYSEHHTGRAVDITTADCEPLSESFEATEAFQWLQENAHQYSFKLSYPKDNSLGIAYEPWHWAYHPVRSPG
jgi:D-alanyl-D-alanine carboxypeptidase